jgi:hypothetical protein
MPAARKPPASLEEFLYNIVQHKDKIITSTLV